jgi:hypothetical protein
VELHLDGQVMAQLPTPRLTTTPTRPPFFFVCTTTTSVPGRVRQQLGASMMKSKRDWTRTKYASPMRKFEVSGLLGAGGGAP